MHDRMLFLFLQVVSNSELSTEPSSELKDDVMRVGSFVSFVSAANSHLRLITRSANKYARKISVCVRIERVWKNNTG